uniref:Peptidase S74 domain-containing protein n=1 Tax=viral metagenome TaxID=1070528 RepID=A0A6C0H829_9ZZZZ
MSNTSYNFKDNLTIDNNKYLKWLDFTGTTRSNIIALDSNNNVNLNSANGQMYINSNNSDSDTFINVSNNRNVFVSSKLAVGINSTDNITASLTLVNSGYIGVNTTRGNSNGYLGLSGSYELANTSGSRVILYGNEHSGSGGQVGIYAGNKAGASVNVFTCNDSLKFSIDNSGSAQFTPNGSIVRCNITDANTTFSHIVRIVDSTAAFSSTSGALQIAGGIGVEGNCFIDGTLSINAATGNINFSGTQTSTSSTSGAVYTTGGIGIANTTTAASVTSGGGLTVAGGVAVAKNLFVGGTVVILDSTAAVSSQTGSMVLYGGLGINNAVWSRNDSAPQMRLAPTTNGSETSISFYATNNYSVSSGNSNAWRVGQNVNSIGTGSFGISSYQTGPVLVCNTSGNVGIGTTSPTAAVQVYSASTKSTLIVGNFNRAAWNSAQINVVSNGAAGSGIAFERNGVDTALIANALGNLTLGHQNGAVTFNSGAYDPTSALGTERMRVTSNGNIGIGTTTPSFLLSLGTFSSNQKLAIYDGGINNFYGLGVNNNLLQLHAGTDSGAFGQLVLSNSGNVGIGTSAPSATLDISGTVFVHSTIEATTVSTGALSIAGGLAVTKSLFIGGPILQLPIGDTASRPTGITLGTIRYNTQTDQFEGYGAGNNWGSLGGVIDVAQTTKILAEESAGSADGNLRFITNNTERMRINSSGNIGIGTSAPNALLDISGTVSVRSTTEATSASSGGSMSIAGGLAVTKSLFVGGPILQLPIGDTASRPTGITLGTIRYNTQTDQFEGYGAGNNWGSLGGVIDVAQTTKILAEESAGSADGNLRFITNNTERMRINSSGNIGIGTSAPSSIFHINSSNTGSIQLGNNNGSGWYTLKNSNGLLGFYTGSFNTGTFRFGCNSVGNFGINQKSPAYALDVNGSTNINSDLYVTGSISGSGSSSSTYAYLTLTATDEAINLTTGAMVTFGGITVQCPTETTSVTNGGSLFVAGGAAIGKSLNVGLGITTGTITTTDLQTSQITTGTILASNVLVSSLLTAGNVNVTSFTSTYAMQTTCSIANLRLTSGTLGNLICTNWNASNVTNGSLVISSTTQSTGIGTGGSLTVLGGASFSKDVYVGGTMTSSSDIRLKTRIRSLQSNSGLPVTDTIDDIRTVIYTLRSEPEAGEHIGFIAQDFLRHYPQLLRRPDDNGYYSLDYSKVTVILLECIKELKNELNTLRERLDSS